MKPAALKLHSTRVWRTYVGGAELDRWLGNKPPTDSTFPEDWIASAVSARNQGRGNVRNEGLSEAELPDGRRVLLRDLIVQDPVGMLGAGHVRKYGENMAVLVKIIDSLGRLTIQVHPDRAFAKNVLSSDYGKTEAWYILGGREIGGQKPYVLLGFRPGMTREKWRRMFDVQDISGMLGSLNHIEVSPGEVFLIEGGVPHAIGSGCFLLEIQEPTDYTIRVERTTPEGLHIADAACHQGAGFDRMFDAFHYDTFTPEEVLARWRIPPRPFVSNDAARETVLIDGQNTPMFGMHAIRICGRYRRRLGPSFCILVAVRGDGRVTVPGGSMDFRQGDRLFLPAAVGEMILDAPRPAEMVLCFPPE